MVLPNRYQVERGRSRGKQQRKEIMQTKLRATLSTALSRSKLQEPGL